MPIKIVPPNNRKIVVLVSVLFIVLFFHLTSASAQSVQLLTAYQDSYPKYYIDNSEGSTQVKGLCMDIIKAIEENVPVTIHAPIGFLPFKRLQQQLADGEIDIFIGMAQNKQRRKKYIFIETPIYEVNHVIAVRTGDTANVQNFNDIRALFPDNTILTNTGTATERFLKKQKGLSIDSGGINLQANLKKLLCHRGRFLYFHDIGLLGAIKQYDLLDKITILPSSFKKYYHYIALAPDTPEEVVEMITRAVQQLAASGELASIQKKYTDP